MRRQFFYLFFLSICLGSCASQQSTHWVSRDELESSTDPNIKQIQLEDGSTIIFDRNLGWFDAKDQIIEGTTITGLHYTTTLTKVQQVEIFKEDHSGLLTWALIILGIGLVAGIVLIIGLSHGQGSGCVVLIAAVGLAFIGATILIFA